MREFALSLRIGLRYMSARLRVPTALIMSIAGIALGVAVLITVMSVMNGFHEELKTRILGFVPHLLLVDDELAHRDPPAADGLGLEIVAIARFVSFDGVLHTKSARTHALRIFGIDVGREADISIVPGRMIAGRLQDLRGHPGIALSRDLADSLDLDIGDEVLLLAPDHPADAASIRPRLLVFQLDALFEVGASPDYGIGLVDVDQALASAPESTLTKGWRVRFEDAMDAGRLAPELAARITQSTGRQPDILSWTQSYGELFQTVRMEKRLMFLLLLFITTIAAFNVVSAQAVAVDQKRAEIAILRTIGMRRGSVSRIFAFQGLITGLAGAFLGVVLGIVLSLNIADIAATVEDWIGFHAVGGTYLVRLPSVISVVDIALISGFAVSLAIASAFYPARRAGALDPVAALNRL